MLERLRSRRDDESGFTLIELLVVMLIIGILAAIAIPAFFSQRDKGYDSDAKANARTVQTAVESLATDNGGSYAGAYGDPASGVAALTGIEGTISNMTNVSVADDGTGGYAIVSTSDSGTTFTITRTNTGTITNSCSAAGGGCKDDLTW